MRDAHARGCEAALVRFKIARGTMAPGHDLTFAHDHGQLPEPAGPRQWNSWSNFNAGAAQHVADASNPSAAAMAPRPSRNTPIAPHLPAPASAAPAAAATASPASRFRLPSMGGLKGALGLGALGALGAGAWGLHKQHQHDVDNRRLTYAPMQGGLY